MPAQTTEELRLDNENLHRRLEETEQALLALQNGEADAILVQSGDEQVYTLEAADRPYRLLVERMAQGGATLNSDGEILYCNERFAALLGQPLEAVRLQPLRDFVTPDSQPRVEAMLQACQGGEVEEEVSFRRESDDHSVHLGAVELKEGALGTCLLVTDLTERRHYEELQRTQAALQAANEALREADRNKDAFLATLAHELRNPLTPVRNAVEIIKAKAPPNPQLDWARGVLDRQVRLMARLLEDLLDVSRISRSMVDLRKERVTLAAVLDAALEIAQPGINSSHHELVVDLPPQPIHLDADPVRLAQVFANLLNNAGKYTETGGQIRLTAEQEGDEVRVSITDSGIGIAAEMLPRVFELFSQAQPALGRSQGGLGIGLSLVKGLVDLHGGTVDARSDGPGHGSEFVVRLPVAGGRPVADTAQARRKDEQEAAANSRILIVDDNRDSADSLAMLLEAMGNDVETAYDGERAIELAEARRPDVVLLDIGMPNLNGYETCRRIREQPWGRDMYLIALTGWGQETDRRRTEEAGFNQHMVKPADPSDLMALIASRAAERKSRDSRQPTADQAS